MQLASAPEPGVGNMADMGQPDADTGLEAGELETWM